MARHFHQPANLRRANRRPTPNIWRPFSTMPMTKGMKSAPAPSRRAAPLFTGTAFRRSGIFNSSSRPFGSANPPLPNCFSRQRSPCLPSKIPRIVIHDRCRPATRTSGNHPLSHSPHSHCPLFYSPHTHWPPSHSPNSHWLPSHSPVLEVAANANHHSGSATIQIAVPLFYLSNHADCHFRCRTTSHRAPCNSINISHSQSAARRVPPP